MSVSNTFWRELYDHLPELVLIFKIGDNDEARLVFANHHIQEALGYTPDQFVLAGETSAKTRQELDELVDQVAQLSQLDQKTSTSPVLLHDKIGNKRKFDFKYNLFRQKANNARFLLIQLTSDGQSNGPVNNEAHTSQSAPTPNAIIVESDLTSAAFEQAYNLARGNQHMLLRGETGVGKRTLIEKVIDWSGWHPAEGIVNYRSSNRMQLSGIEPGEHGVIGIHHISNMPGEDQHTLNKWLKSYNLKIVASSTQPLETELEKNHFSEELYYRLSFQTILIPPLRNRPEDLEKLVENWLKPLANQLGYENFQPTAEQINQLKNRAWPQNFHSFFRLMRKGLLQMEEGGEFTIPESDTDTISQSSQTHTEEIGPLLTFDEMNRRYLKQVLDYTDGKIYGKGGAAAILDLKPTTLQSKLKKLNVR